MAVKSEKEEFLKVYVLTQTSDEERDAFVSRVNELDIHQRNCYSCEDRGMIFKYHSIRVEYNNNNNNLFIDSDYI